MFKRTLFSVLGILLIFMVSLKLSTKIQDGFLYVTDNIKQGFINSQIFIFEGLRKHFDQERQIAELLEKNKENERLHLELAKKDAEIDALIEELRVPSFAKEYYRMIRSISYVNLGDYNKIWLDYTPKNENEIIGLIQKGYAAGIMINKNGRAMGLLNGDTKCSYAVYVGEEKAPGMLTGRGDEEKIYIEFIPSWKEIKINDEVVTSGLDNVFFEGIRIGYVTDIEESLGYKIAKIKSYADTLHPRAFWIRSETNTSAESARYENNISE